MLHFKKLVRILQPEIFILGLFIGFILCSVTGFIVSKYMRFTHFNRFFRVTQPESHFYPTISELLVTARYEANLNKTLILVGGSSILRGAGQNPDEVWTITLQKLLGDQYKVINFAADGAGITSFAGVAFRVLVEEYNKIFFISDCAKHGDSAMDGVTPYAYIFWDAYYKNLLHLDKIEKKRITKIRKDEMSKREGVELHFMSYLDSLFYFRDFWSWISYRFVFTVWNDFTYRKPFRPRYRYSENKLDLKEGKIQNENARFQKEAEHLESIISQVFDLSKTPIQYKEDVLVNIRRSYDEGYTPRYRSKILCVITPDNPKHLSHISTKLEQSSKDMNRLARDLLIALNYHAIDMGQNFVPEDFYDSRHLSASGGNKVAIQVAKEVKNMAKINYVSIENS